MLNANDLRVNRARQKEMERAASKERAAREARNPKAPLTRTSWARLANLFL